MKIVNHKLIPPMKKHLLLSACLVLFAFLSNSYSAEVFYYVNAETGDDTNSGADWNNAFKTLSHVLNIKVNDTKVIYLAAGTYYPTSLTNRGLSFNLSNVKIYGGYIGTDENPNDRNPTIYKTILSGDIGIEDDPSDNSYQVITVSGSTLLDGLIISDGNGVGAGGDQELGGGIYFKITPNFFQQIPTFSISDCQINNNQAEEGAGIYISYDVSKPGNGLSSAMTIANCNFSNNIATKNGGGLCLTDLNKNLINVNLEDCQFNDNHAESGGGLYVENTDINISRTAFNKNGASSKGLSIFLKGGAGTGSQDVRVVNIDNSTIYNPKHLTGFDESLNIKQQGLLYFAKIKLSLNSSTLFGKASETDALLFYEENNNTLDVNNSILWNDMGGGKVYARIEDGEFFDAEIRHTMTHESLICVDDPNTDEPECPVVILENVFIDYPEFVDSSSGDLRLNIFSPAIDKGDNEKIKEGEKDKMGKARKYGQTEEPVTDLGAHEFDGTSISLTIPSEANDDKKPTMEYTDSEGWTHYIDANNLKLILSVKKDGQDIGELGKKGFDVRAVTKSNYGKKEGATDLSDANYLQNADMWFAFNRFWEVKNAEALTNPLAVRFYYLEEDIADLQQSIDEFSFGLGGNTELKNEEIFFYTVNSPGSNPHSKSVTPSQFQQYSFDESPSLSTWTDGNFNGIPYAEFLVSEFAGGGSAGATTNGLGPLPVELLSFTAERKADDVLLKWATASEINNSHFLVERSFDGSQFVPIGSIKGAGNTTEITNYQYLDKQARRGLNYYRLKQIDFDGAFEYSEVVSVNLSNKEPSILLFPNPTINAVNIQLPEVFTDQPVTIRVFNVVGQQLLEVPIASANSELQRFDVQQYVPGTYLLVAQNDQFYFTKRFLVNE